MECSRDPRCHADRANPGAPTFLGGRIARHSKGWMFWYLPRRLWPRAKCCLIYHRTFRSRWSSDRRRSGRPITDFCVVSMHCCEFRRIIRRRSPPRAKPIGLSARRQGPTRAIGFSTPNGASDTTPIALLPRGSVQSGFNEVALQVLRLARVARPHRSLQIQTEAGQ